MGDKTKLKGRGGAGRGQGRRPKLSNEHRTWIYDRYWQLYRQAVEDDVQYRSDELNSRLDEPELVLKEIHSIPPNAMSIEDEQPWRKVMTTYVLSGGDPEQAPEHWPDYVLDAAFALRLRKDQLKKYGNYIPAKRPIGKIKTIYKQVAKEASKKLPTKITPGYVEWISKDIGGEHAD